MKRERDMKTGANVCYAIIEFTIDNNPEINGTGREACSMSKGVYLANALQICTKQSISFGWPMAAS